MKKVLLSYDYELYFNESFSDEVESLIQPAHLIFRAYKQTGVRCTFFVDTECILKYKQIGRFEVVSKIEDQLLQFIEEGFDVQLHLHPIWESAHYSTSGFSFNYDDYDLKEISIEVAKKYVIRGKNYLESLLREKKPDYKCIAFRAGGFCLPNNEEFIAFLSNNGFVFDSSIVPNAILRSQFQSYDYIGKKSLLKSLRIKEIPILTTKKLTLFYLINHKKYCFDACLRGKGSPVIPLNSKINQTINKIREYALITLDTHSFQFVTKIMKKNKDDVVSIIGHPKLENEIAVNNTVKLIADTRSLYEYLTFTQYMENYCV